LIQGKGRDANFYNNGLNMCNLKKIFAIGFLSLITMLINAQSSAIVSDGKFSESAWDSATVLYNKDSIKIVCFQTKHDFVVGVVAKGFIARYVDMYMKANNKLYNLHASFQVGERVLLDTGFTDEKPDWQWGNNKNWKVNTVAYQKNANEKLPFRQQLNAYDGYEFVIQKTKIGAGNLLLRIEIKGFEEGAPQIFFPKKSTRFSQRKWKQIKIS
jgi:hypothetical protein